MHTSLLIRQQMPSRVTGGTAVNRQAKASFEIEHASAPVSNIISAPRGGKWPTFHRMTGIAIDTGNKRIHVPEMDEESQVAEPPYYPRNSIMFPKRKEHTTLGRWSGVIGRLV